MFRSIAAMSGISVVIMLIALDQTVVGTALPRMVAELQGFELYPWVASSYLLTNAILIPLTGRLGDLYGRKLFLIAAIILFTLASTLCGQASSMLELVLARGIQGIGGGMLVGSAFASVSDLFPETLERVRWQVMLSSAFGISSAVGPVLGGWMTESFGWRSVFYVNLPIGLIALPIVWAYLPRIVHTHHDASRHIDWLGVILLTIAVASLLMLTEFGPQMGFLSPYFLGLFVATIIFAVVFVHHQHHSQSPIIPTRLFENPTIRKLSLLSTLTGFVMFVLVFYTPLLLQGGFGKSPDEAGLLITPILVSITIGSIINGRLIPRIRHPERLFSYGVSVLAIGIILLSVISESTPWGIQMSIFALCGFGLGFQLPNLTIQMQAAADIRDQGAASALIQMLRTIGSMFGASVAGALVYVSYSREIQKTLASRHLNSASVRDLFATPQILLRTADQTKLFQELGSNAHMLLQDGRLGLVSGIHVAFLGCVLVATISYLIGRKLPAFICRSKAVDS